MLDSDTEGEGDIGGTINPSVAMAIAGGPLAPGSRASISQGPSAVSLRLIPRDGWVCGSRGRVLALASSPGTTFLHGVVRTCGLNTAVIEAGGSQV